jgi:hypothetical protein
MNDPAIAQMIREVLAEELGKLRAARAAGPARPGSPETLWVSVRNDGELQDLVHRVLALSADPAARKALESGRTVFRLQRDAGVAEAAAPAAAAPAAEQAAIEKGVLSERMVDRLPAGTPCLVIGRSVRVTPLAKDRLRQRRIRVERKDS